MARAKELLEGLSPTKMQEVMQFAKEHKENQQEMMLYCARLAEESRDADAPPVLLVQPTNLLVQGLQRLEEMRKHAEQHGKSVKPYTPEMQDAIDRALAGKALFMNR